MVPSDRRLAPPWERRGDRKGARMKEQKIYDHVRGLGHEPIEGTAIVVTRTP